MARSMHEEVVMQGVIMGGLPEPGQLVEVRRRQYVVADIVASKLPSDTLQDPISPRQHLVTLSAVEEDSLGEELRVVWEIEPGARIHEGLLLPKPDDFDPPSKLGAFLDAVRWGAIETADSRSLHSPFRAGISIEDYQLDPVVRALRMPRVNLLIADDVGLGKTIEAGLVAQELILRHRVRSILIVVPASLQIKWRDEMHDRFGLDFRIIDSDGMKRLRRRRGVHVNPWTHFPRLITSIDYLKRDRPMRLMRQCLPAVGEPVYPRRFDLLIVDEAHNAAPSGSGRYAKDSDRTRAIRTLAPHFENKLFLTATPHNGYKESFSALLELLDEQRFARDVEPDRDQLDAVMVHRLKTEIENPDGSKRFPERHLEAIEVAYNDREREAHKKLQQYASVRLATDGRRRGVATAFVQKLLKKRLFSCPQAFLDTLQEHLKTLRGIEKGERSRPTATEVGILRRELEDVAAEEADDEDAELLALEAVATASSYFEDLGDEERSLLRNLEDWATEASGRPDSKALALIAWLRGLLISEGGWNDERVIIFTEYRATQKWLFHILQSEGLAGDGRLETIYGGLDTDERERIKAAFQTNPSIAPIRVLLATDTASEGIDLQNWCHNLIHYEIPWNPNRLEQRNGRIDRHGQKADAVLIHHFVGAGWQDGKDGQPSLEGDLEFLMRAAIKVENIRQDLGKVGPVIAEQVEQFMLGKRRELDTRQAERDAEPVRKMLRFERNLRELISQLHERLMESKTSLRVGPANLYGVVSTALELAGQLPLQPVHHPEFWPREKGSIDGSPVFELPHFSGSWSRCLAGLPHPHTREVRPVVFDHDLAMGRDDVVLVHLNHPLVRMSQQLLRAEIWAPSGGGKINRVCVVETSDTGIIEPTVVAHARLMVAGGGDRRLHEELLATAGTFGKGRLSRMNVGQTKAVLEAVTETEAGHSAKARIQKIWPAIEDAIGKSITARAEERVGGIASNLTRRMEQEVSDMTAIMEELSRNIQAELDAEPPVQRDLFDEDERSQFERNRESLERRVAEIPEEIKREAEAIRRRYDNPTPWCFPVALTFIVPHGWPETP
jgi:superfamily II DNA or RNA helicase